MEKQTKKINKLMKSATLRLKKEDSNKQQKSIPKVNSPPGGTGTSATVPPPIGLNSSSTFTPRTINDIPGALVSPNRQNSSPATYK
jgi:hypothetical protein